ncbi:MAG: EVE domain-containing protein [Bacteroidia bacterium]|nr:EVE domain-containing protein [Bacteroidia bacterium]
MKYWLVKQEPEAYSWDTFVQEGETLWTGVRNYQARNNLQEMSYGDFVLFYHSQSDKAVVGIAQVSSEQAIPDPTSPNDTRWVCVKLSPYKTLSKPVTLAQIKAQPELTNIALVRQARLSVMPLTEQEFQIILQLGETML